MNAKRKLLVLTASLALTGFASIASAQEIYIPLISKMLSAPVLASREAGG